MVVGCRGGVNINPRHLMMPEVLSLQLHSPAVFIWSSSQESLSSPVECFVYAGKHLWCSFGHYQSSGVGRDGGNDLLHTSHRFFYPIRDFSFNFFFKINLQAAIVAGIESGWVNPVINKEYAMEEVGDHCCIVSKLSNIISLSCIKINFIQEIH